MAPKVDKKEKKIKKKKKKDPDAPKRNLSTFLIYSIEIREKIKNDSSFQGKPQEVITKHIGELWKQVSAEEKLRLQGIVDVDKKRYEKELKEYEESGKKKLWEDKIKEENEKEEESSDDDKKSSQEDDKKVKKEKDKKTNQKEQKQKRAKKEIKKSEEKINSDSDSDSSSSSNEKKINMIITDDHLREKIIEYIENSLVGMENVSLRLLRLYLEDFFKADLSKKKGNISNILTKLIEENKNE